MKRLLATCYLVLAAAPFAWSQITLDFAEYGGGNTLINDWTLTVTVNGDGTVSIADSAGIGFDDGSGLGVGVSGAAGVGVSGSFDLIFDGISNTGGDTQVQLRPTGLGAQGRNSGRIDWNPSLGDAQSEEIDIFVDTSNLLAGNGLTFTEFGLGNYQDTTEPILTDFGGVDTTLAAQEATATLGGAGYTLASGETGTLFLATSDAGATGALQGYSLQSLTFDFAETPAMEVFIDRSNGNVTLDNASGVDFNIAGLSLLSDSGSLVPGNWLSIAENYDSGGGDGGDGSVDPDDTWTIFSSISTDLSEGTLGTTTIADSDTINFGNAYMVGGTEDVTLEYLDADTGQVAVILPTFVDGDGDPFLLGDADGDGDVDGDDLIAVQTEFGNTGAMPLLGDADNDGDVDGDDLIAVQTEFGNTLSVAVPEPTGLATLTLACLLAAGRARSGKRG